MVMKPFKTYFDAYTSLAAHLKQAADEVFREHKNQPNYTAKLNLAIHRAYQRWATESGISSEDMRDLAIALSKFSSDYVLGPSFYVNMLVSTLPNEFNVRGKWTPE
jgi:hypothetical protein